MSYKTSRTVKPGKTTIPTRYSPVGGRGPRDGVEEGVDTETVVEERIDDDVVIVVIGCGSEEVLLVLAVLDVLDVFDVLEVLDSKFSGQHLR